MVNFFDNHRYWGNDNCTFLKKIGYYRAVNGIVIILANFIMPIYYRITRNNPKYQVREIRPFGQRIIVSLTSFPVRLPRLHLAIESILHQSVHPDRLILYLTRSQVPDIERLPKKLLSLRARGLEIVLCDDQIRSHTKYYYAMQTHPRDIVITVDDDIMYRNDLLATLVKAHQKFPHVIVVNWAKMINASGKYNQWRECKEPFHEFPNGSLFGVHGVLYPPGKWYEDMFSVDLIKDLCLTADDIWISCMAILSKRKMVYTGYCHGHLPILIPRNETLISGNYVRNQKCVDKLNDYYLNKIGKRPLVYNDESMPTPPDKFR